MTQSRYGAPRELGGSAGSAGQDAGAAHWHPDVVHLEGDEAGARGTGTGLAAQDHHGLVDGHRVERRRLPPRLDVHAAAAQALGEGQLAWVAVLVLINAADCGGTRSVSPLPCAPQVTPVLGSTVPGNRDAPGKRCGGDAWGN